MNKLSGLTIALLIAAVVALGGFAFYQTQLKTGEVTFTVDSKERIAENNDGKYLVFSTDDQVYQVTDNLLFGMTDSSNRYAALDEGVTYKCETIGIRFSLFSLYQNLRNCEEVK